MHTDPQPPVGFDCEDVCLEGFLDFDCRVMHLTFVGSLPAAEVHELPDDDEIGVGNRRLDALRMTEQRLSVRSSRCDE